MAPAIVIDSGVLIASVLDETLSKKARNALSHWTERNLQVNAPVLFRYEIVAVIRKAVSQGRIKPERGMNIRDNLLEYPVQLHVNDVLLKRAYELATQLNRPTAYDSQYLAVAEHLGCNFWTVDERLFNAVSHTLKWVKWLENFEPGTQENS